MNGTFRQGQAWISDSEPELGLGFVSETSRLTVRLDFRASGEVREYAGENAPLRRVRFHPGDMVTGRDGRTLRVESVEERDGLIHYIGGSREICETALSDTISFSKPEERLFVGQVDAPQTFDLRLRALHHQHRRRKSPTRGFVGGRIDLIPHQLSIATDVTFRLAPRVLLADEVGLGKTIEAGLILHRLLLTGLARRVLILVPDSLVHQWLVEMLRRFNIWFRVFDERRCAAIETARPGANPFLDDQLILASLRLFAGNEKRVDQAVAAGWDILVVDEAHHLSWTPETVSPEYRAVECLSRSASGLLLLTATPEQLGMESHFARLRLLDPARFHDLETFLRETEGYREIAEEVEGLADPAARAALLDRHGTGRVMFRNTRATVRGFPERHAHLSPLDPAEDEASTSDPRIRWLLGLLRKLEPEKVLLICRTRETVEAIEATLRERHGVKAAMFHEGLSLVRRDRHAAWFAEEDGVRLLICSEIGSEGRNFQFARHLVMFDLPLPPELVEQRVGRLDRIGQRSAIQIHVPFLTGRAEEVLVRWHHEGLNDFEENLHGGHRLRDLFGTRVEELAGRFHEMNRDRGEAELLALIRDTVAAREEVRVRLEQGRDRLLELNSFRPAEAAALIERIREADADTSLDDFMIAVFDHFAIPVEEVARRTYQLGSAGVLADTFPGLPTAGLAVTCDRERALRREDIQFLTWDHPLVTGAIDALLGSEKGNSSFAWWRDSQVTDLYLEALYLLECVAPPALHIDRFLPATPLRVLVDHRAEDRSAAIAAEAIAPLLQRGDARILVSPEVRETLLPRLLARSREIAEARVEAIVTEARTTMAARLDQEIERLEELRKVNPSVRPEEIELLVSQRESLGRYLENARLRLDAVRVIQRGP
jgi:ATP-dependent helicase HepA